MKNLLVLTALLVPACASIVEGSSQEVSIRTEPNQPSSCVIKGSSGETKVEAPAKITISKSYYPKEITCTPNSGGDSGTAQVLSDVAPWGYGGAVLGTAIGAGVDTYTGAAFQYPNEIVVKLGTTTEIGKSELN